MIIELLYIAYIRCENNTCGIIRCDVSYIAYIQQVVEKQVVEYVECILSSRESSEIPSFVVYENFNSRQRSLAQQIVDPDPGAKKCRGRARSYDNHQ